MSVSIAGSGDAASRQAKLAAAVSRLRTKAGGTDPERWLLIGGGILLPLGLLMIFLGWQGASSTPRLFEQIPYMISGGLLGLGLVFFGGFLYFAYWLTKLVQENRAHTTRLTDALERLEQRMGTMVLAPLDLDQASQWGAPNTRASRNGHAGAFVATANGTMYHRADCAVVASKDGLRPVTPGSDGFKPCSICQPDSVEV